MIRMLGSRWFPSSIQDSRRFSAAEKLAQYSLLCMAVWMPACVDKTPHALWPEPAPPARAEPVGAGSATSSQQLDTPQAQKKTGRETSLAGSSP